MLSLGHLQAQRAETSEAAHTPRKDPASSLAGRKHTCKPRALEGGNVLSCPLRANRSPAGLPASSILSCGVASPGWFRWAVDRAEPSVGRQRPRVAERSSAAANVPGLSTRTTSPHQPTHPPALQGTSPHPTYRNHSSNPGSGSSKYSLQPQFSVSPFPSNSPPDPQDRHPTLT